MTSKDKATLTLSSTARSAIATAYSTALTSHENSGNVITQVCSVALKYCKGEEIAKADREAIVEAIASDRGWPSDAKQRRSETGIVLKAYASLGEAIEMFRKKADKCQWHDGIKLARQLAKGASVKEAVAAAFETSSTTKVVSPQGRTAGALKGWYKVAKGEKRAAILKAATLLGLDLRV